MSNFSGDKVRPLLSAFVMRRFASERERERERAREGECVWCPLSLVSLLCPRVRTSQLTCEYICIRKMHGGYAKGGMRGQNMYPLQMANGNGYAGNAGAPGVQGIMGGPGMQGMPFNGSYQLVSI